MTCLDSVQPFELVLNGNPTALDLGGSNVVTMGVGTPPQQVKMTPSTIFYNNVVHVAPPCNNKSDEMCNPTHWGGIYTPSQSRTYKAIPYSSWNGSHVHGQAPPDALFFSDVLAITNNSGFSDVPFEGLTPVPDKANYIGIGQNSTTVTQAYTAGLSTSRSWGLYIGSKTAPGSLILGGYSPEFISGDLFGQTCDPACFICTKVASVSFNTPNESISILQPGQTPFTAKLEPFDNWFSFPDIIYDDWVRLTNGTVGPRGFTVYNNDSVPQGNLSITLTNGIQVIIPHEDLFTSNAINGDGALLIPSPDTQIAKVKATGTRGLLGFPYMSQVYVIYDDDRRTLNISKVNSGATSSGKFTKICPTLTSPGNSTTDPTEPPDSSHHKGPAIIAGAVIGSVFLLAMVTVALFVVRRQKRKRRYRGKESALRLEKDGCIPHLVDHPAHRETLQKPAEIGGAQRTELPTRLPTYELPTSDGNSGELWRI